MLAKRRFGLAFLVLLLAALACNAPGANGASSGSGATAVDLTKVALEIQATNNAPAVLPPVDTTKIALEIKATDLAAGLTQQAGQQPAPATTQAPAPAATTEIPATSQPTAQDMSSLIKNAKILVYEDAATVKLDDVVKSTLDLMGLKYIHVGDAIGSFMGNLNSSTRWDLIIVAAESRNGVQGEFWDVITPKVTSDKTALVVEMWYLSQIANGRIQGLTSKCGIAYQSTRSYVDSIYTLDPTNPIFSTPNGGFSLTNYSTHWTDKGGDYVRLTGSGDATLIAGGFMKEKSRYGMLTSCLGGRVVIQTFSTHDYHRETMQMLWENYITDTLTNHFKALAGSGG